VSSTSYVNVQITSTITNVVNQFNTTLTANSSTNRVTLPAGKYYLDANLYIKRPPPSFSHYSTYGVEYIFYEFSGGTKTEIGFLGREGGAVNIGNPQKSEHAVAYIASDGTAEIGLQVKKINTLNVQVSGPFGNYNEPDSRFMIWRIE
tara:strand:- start:80 stop:523 length:444 start_codon:yes stop_codon:yes gene_type:complete